MHHASTSAAVLSELRLTDFDFPYTNRSNCRAALKRTATANGLSPDDFVITEHGARDFRFSRTAAPVSVVAAEPAKVPPTSDDGVPNFLKIPTADRREAWVKAPPRVSRAFEPTTEAEMAKMKKAAAKKAAKNTPPRDDNLKAGSKQAIMLDMVLSPDGATEQAVCAKLGWKKCRVTIRRVCEKVGATLDVKKNVKGETVFFATMPKGKK